MDTTILTAIAAVVLIPVAGLFAALDAALSTVSVARPRPTSLARRCVPPAAGMMPSPVSGSANCAFVEATRMSHARASSWPPPNA